MKDFAKNYAIFSSLIGGSASGGDFDALIDRTITEVNSEVEEIGDNAFYYCTNLTSANIPKATSIGQSAFQSCTGLASVDFPVATSIGGYAFDGCSALTTLVLRKSDAICTLGNSNSFTNTPIESGTGYIYVPRALIDAYKTATNWSTYANQFRVLEDYTVEGTVTGELDESKLRSYTVYFYNGDTLLGQVDNVPYGGSATYTGETLIKTGVDDPENYEFDKWSPEPTNITGETHCYAVFKFIGVYSTAMIERTLSGDYYNDRVTSVGDYAFYSCKKLTSVDIPNATSAVGESAFMYCENLTSVDIPNATSVGDHAFHGCKKLTSVNISNATSVGEYAFASCTNLTSVDFPLLTSVGYDDVFYNCVSLTSVDFPLLTTLGQRTFISCKNLTSVNIPLLTSTGSDAFGSCESLTSVDFPLLARINQSAFNKCTSLTSVNLPAATQIGYSAFKNCTNLTRVDFPSATTMDNYAFEGCSSLTRADLPLVTGVGYQAFYSCGSLTTLILRKNDTICTLSNVNAFTNTPIASGTGYIYVPQALIEDYKVASNWSTYANQFRAIEDYPEICGGGDN